MSFESSGFRDWRRGAVYTVRDPDVLPCRVLVAVRTLGGAYADLYRRAAGLAGVSRITAQAWGRHHGVFSFNFATIAAEIGGESGFSVSPPTSEELSAPHGTPPAGAEGPTHHFDRIYNDFDFGAPDEVMMFSYGEYVHSAEGLDFARYVGRAEQAARRHHASCGSACPFDVLRREWLFAGDARAMQAVVHVYFRT